MQETIFQEITIEVRKHINAIDDHSNDGVLSYHIPILFQVNMLHKLTIPFNIFYHYNLTEFGEYGKPFNNFPRGFKTSCRNFVEPIHLH